MTDAGDSGPASKREEKNSRVEVDADSDEEVFHDARFPAEEEAVSYPDLRLRETGLIFTIVTESSEGSPRDQGRGKPAIQCRMLRSGHFLLRPSPRLMPELP
jgi:hypothetical protein